MKLAAWIGCSLALAGAVACGDDRSGGVAGKVAEQGGGGGGGGGAGASPVPAARDRVEHAVWNLAANRHTAHREVAGDLVVDGGDAGLARYTRFGLAHTGWKLRVPVESDAGPVSTGEFNRVGSLELPLTEAQAQARSVWLRVHATKPGTLTVRLGDERTGSVARAKLGGGWQTIALPMERGWQVGENDLQLASNLDGDDVHLRWLRVSSQAAPEGPPPDDDPLAAASWAGDDTLRLAPGAAVVWYVIAPTGGVVVGDVDGALVVDATSGDGATTSAELTGPSARADLSQLAGAAIRLRISNRSAAVATLRGGHVALAGPAPTSPPAGPPPKYVVWWIWDSTRADKLPVFTPGARAETPTLAALAEHGAVFRQHYVGGNESQTSHSSMFTSLYPAVHEVRTAGNDIHYVIPKKYPTVGALVAAAGVHTIGVTGNGYVGAFGGYARGFDEFRNMMQERGAVNARLPGELIVDDVIARLERQVPRGEPTMVYLGTVDSHSPWVARKPWIDRYDPDYRGPFEESATPGPLGLMKGKMGCHRVPPEREIERLRAIYDSTLSYQDDQLGRLLAALERLGIREQTMIIVTADHGDELFEERRCGHGASLRDSLARVPLLIHYPPRIAARVVEEGSEGIDILPTVLDVLDAPALERAQGRSLRPVAAGHGAGWAEPSFASQYEYAFAARLGRWKARVKRGTPLVFDMVADPDERTDLAETRPLERRLLTDQLGLFLAHRTVWRKAAWGTTSNMTAAGAAALDPR
ncbi:MAG: sulfatase [Kofleriaceae bacterium]